MTTVDRTESEANWNLKMPRTRIGTHLLLFTLLPLTYSLLITATPGLSQDARQERLIKEMKSRHEQIMENKTADILEHILIQEKYLQYALESVKNELKARKDVGFGLTQADLDEIYGLEKELISEYREELLGVIRAHDELIKLQQNPTASSDEETKERLHNLKLRLRAILEESDLDKPGSLSPQLAELMLYEYNHELERILDVVRSLYRLGSDSPQDPDIQDEVDHVRQGIVRELGEIADDRKDPLIDDYVRETTSIIQTLRELDALERNFPLEDLNIHLGIREVKEKLFQAVPLEALVALGYHEAQFRHDSDDMQAYFDSWMAGRIFWIQTKAKQAELIKQKLIETGRDHQVKRMFDEDANRAVVEYDAANFEIAGLLFSDIIKFYPYKRMEDFKFYLAESLWMQQQFSRAKAVFRDVVNEAPRSEYAPIAYYRLMLIGETFGRHRELFSYAKELSKFPSADGDELVNKAMLFAGYVAHSANDLDKALQFVGKVDDRSLYYGAAQYLQAVAYVNLDRRQEAKSILSNLSSEGSSALDGQARTIRNYSLLKLGMLYYNEDDLENALGTLERIDPHFNKFDLVLLAKAWTKFRLGLLQAASEDLDGLYWQQLNSSYVYEAMMLAAHCNILLGNVEESTRRVRYVENAKKALEIDDGLNSEHRRINQIQIELEELEKKAVAKGDLLAFEHIKNLSTDLDYTTQSFSDWGGPGMQLLKELDSEELKLLALLGSAADYDSLTAALGRPEISKSLRKISRRLALNWARLNKLRSTGEVDIMTDYPVAKRESGLKSQNYSFSRLGNQVQLEQQALRRNKRELAGLIAKAEKNGDHEALALLELRSRELENLFGRLESFNVRLAESGTEELETDYTAWADFSGFGMSDEGFVRMQEISQGIQIYNNNMSAINDAFREKESQLQVKIAFLDEEITDLERQEKKARLDELKAERDRYFAEEYFINSFAGTDVGSQEGPQQPDASTPVNQEPEKPEKEN